MMMWWPRKRPEAKSTPGNTSTRKATNKEKQVELYLETPNQAREFILQCQQPHRYPAKLGEEKDTSTTIIRLSPKLFGPPSMSIPYKLRQELFHSVQQYWQQQQQQCQHHQNGRGVTLIIEGTLMGQVLPGELVALAIPASPASLSTCQLQVLEIHAGLVLDDMSTSVMDLALALQHASKSLRRLCLRNFLNHALPVPNVSLLDPIVHALSNCQELEYLEVSCLVSFVHWSQPLLSTSAFRAFWKNVMNRQSLRHLELTNLGLEDDHIEALMMYGESYPSTPCPMETLIWNANDTSIRGLESIILGMRAGSVSTRNTLPETSQLDADTTLLYGNSNTRQHKKFFPHLKRLSMMNHAKLTDEVFELLFQMLQTDYSNPLQYFECTLPVSHQQHYRACLTPYLKLHRLPLQECFYNSTTTITPRVSSQPFSSRKNIIDHVLSPVIDDLDVLFLLLKEKPSLCDTAKANAVATHETQSYHNMSWWFSSRRPLLLKDAAWIKQSSLLLTRQFFMWLLWALISMGIGLLTITTMLLLLVAWRPSSFLWLASNEEGVLL